MAEECRRWSLQPLCGRADETARRECLHAVAREYGIQPERYESHGQQRMNVGNLLGKGFPKPNATLESGPLIPARREYDASGLPGLEMASAIPIYRSSDARTGSDGPRIGHRGDPPDMLLDRRICEMRTFDFSPLYRSAVGFDRLMSVLDVAQKTSGDDGYPPYNVEKTGDDAYRVTVAVAGFGPDELDVQVRDGQLVVSGKTEQGKGKATYLHRGIAKRAFQRRFHLADHVEVKGADLQDGLLVVDLEREIPEALKPRQIPIAGGQAERLAEAA